MTSTTAFQSPLRVSIGRSIENFDYTPYLPKSGRPGKIPPARTRIRLCESGWHFTIRPEVHWRKGADSMSPETKGGSSWRTATKLTAIVGRLVERVTPEWAWLPFYPVVRLLLAVEWRNQNPSPAPNASVANRPGPTCPGRPVRGRPVQGQSCPGPTCPGPPVRGQPVRGLLSGADLSGPTCPGPTCPGRPVRGRSVQGQPVRGQLSGAYLSGANLSGADLSRANLSGANLSGPTCPGPTCPGPPVRGLPVRGNLSGADLSRANLSGPTCPGPLPVRGLLSGANLSGAYNVPHFRRAGNSVSLDCGARVTLATRVALASLEPMIEAYTRRAWYTVPAARTNAWS